MLKKPKKPKPGNPFYKGASPEDVARALLRPRKNEITKQGPQLGIKDLLNGPPEIPPTGQVDTP